MARKRYQRGRVFLRGKNPVWVGRYREDVIGLGEAKPRRVHKAIVLGTLKELPTQKLALRRMESQLVRINAPGYRAGRAATVGEFAEKWQEQVLVNQKPSGARAVKSHLKVHVVKLLGHLKLEDVTREVQQEFVTRLGRGHSRKMVYNVLGTLSVLLRWAKRWGYVVEVVDRRELSIPRGEPKKVARYFTGEEAGRIIAAAEEPWKTMFLVAAMSGVRAGELLALQWDDFDYERKLLWIRRSAWHGRIQTVKSESSRKPLPLPVALEAAVRAYRQSSWRPNDAGLLWASRKGRPLLDDWVRRKVLRPVLVRAGVAQAGLHAFRHTHCSLLLATGATPVVTQSQMRHSDARITLGTYGHVMGDGQREAVERVAAAIVCSSGPKVEAASEMIQ